jgi:hypothetical protein
MMQQPFGKPYDPDIDRAHDWRLSLLSQDEFRAAPANVQRQQVGNSLREAGTNAEHGSFRFFFAGENFDIEAGLEFDRSTNAADSRRHERRSSPRPFAPAHHSHDDSAPISGTVHAIHDSGFSRLD